jgi:transposase, IS30 family
MRRKRWWRLPAEVRREVMRLAAQGLSYNQILARVDISMGSVGNVLRPLGGVIRQDMLGPAGARLSLEERVEILLGLERGWSYRRIGSELGRAGSTICREVAAGGGRGRYKPVPAHHRARLAARRPKERKLAASPRLCAAVTARLEQLHSPQQIAAWLKQHGDASLGSVSHETIYKSLYVQGRGELRRELAACLRTGRAARKPRGRLETRGRITGMVNISDRPAEADDRAVPGHWEGDLIIGKGNKSAVVTLAERASRYCMIIALPHGHTAQAVAGALTAHITTLPKALRRSLTWDQGKEMTNHATFTIATGVPVYFADPHSPWQRGTNENTNGLIRYYLPKSTDLSTHTQADLDTIAHTLNTRPRATLDFATPAETLNDLLVATAA